MKIYLPTKYDYRILTAEIKAVLWYAKTIFELKLVKSKYIMKDKVLLWAHRVHSGQRTDPTRPMYDLFGIETI